MGSAASTLTKTQVEEMERLKKIEQEANPAANEEEIEKILMDKHKEAFDNALKENANAPLATPSKAPPADKKADAAAVGGMQKTPSNPKLATGKSKGPTRRRSFGEVEKKSGTATPAKSGIATSESALAISTAVAAAAGTAETQATEQKDSWDSVSEQPYCAVCLMGFKTASALDRHVKYSDLHAKQVAKLAKDGAPLSPGATPFNKDKKTLQASQEEGTHYRLLYSGSKLFWRTGDNLDFDIYFHVIAHCIEVIAYDNVKSREWRLYFQYEKMLALLGDQVQDKLVAIKAEKSKSAANNKFNVTPSEDVTTGMYEAVLLEEARQAVITSFLLNRIQMTNNPTAAAPLPEIQFVASQAGDDVALMTTPPGGLIPINVNRRRKTSSEEITSTISTLQMDYAALRNATARAERVASLVFESANMLTAFIQDQNASKWAKKWRWAIRLVIRQARVAETTAHLAKLEEARLARERELAGPEPAGARLSVQKLRRSFEGKP